MRTQAVKVLPAYKISQGPSDGIVLLGLQLNLNAGAGNHVLLRIIPSGFLGFRGGTSLSSRPTGLPAVPGEQANWDTASANGIECVYGLAVTGDLAYAGNESTWNTYIANSLNNAKAQWPPNGPRFITWRNEPGDVTTWASELHSVYPLVKSILPNCQFGGMVGTTGLGSTPGRNTNFPGYIANGGLATDTIDVLDFHTYPGSSSPNPELLYASEVRWVVDQALAVRPTLGIAISEFGWQNAIPGAVDYQDVVTSGKYQSRMFFILRCVPNMKYICMYHEADSAGSGRGIYDEQGNTKANYQSVVDTAATLNGWVSAAAYSRGIPKLRTSTTGYLPSFLASCLWMAQGTKANGDQELACWHASSSAWLDQVVVFNSTSTAQTLNTKVIGGATTSQSVSPGLTAIPLTLNATPLVLSGTGLRFPME